MLFENLNIDVGCPDLSPFVTNQDALRPIVTKTARIHRVRASGIPAPLTL